MNKLNIYLENNIEEPFDIVNNSVSPYLYKNEITKTFLGYINDISDMLYVEVLKYKNSKNYL